MTTPCKYHVAAVGLDCKGKVLGTCSNTPRFGKKGGSKHAEMNLMRKFGRKVKVILLFRITNGGKLRHIDPCSACAEKAWELGIKIRSV